MLLDVYIPVLIWINQQVANIRRILKPIRKEQKIRIVCMLGQAGSRRNQRYDCLIHHWKLLVAPEIEVEKGHFTKVRKGIVEV